MTFFLCTHLHLYWVRFRIKAKQENQKINKQYAWLRSDSHSENLSHVCNQEWLLDRPCPAGEPLIVHREEVGFGGSGGRRGCAAKDIHGDSLQNLVDWLHVRENACGKRILNQHSSLPSQCKTNASAANPHKHMRQGENCISFGDARSIFFSIAMINCDVP